MAGPLAGVKVLEFSEIIAGPFGGMLLADMGAEVIKVEPPWGEAWRLNAQFMPLESKSFISLNRGKRSLPLDLTRPQARQIVHRLVPQTDVVLVNYRPDVPARLGIDYEALSAINPRLIYCATTAFGRFGPDSSRPGYDIIVQAMSGLMAGDGKVVGGVPQQISATALADFSTGISIAWAVCGALYARERTGVGQKVEAALLGTALGIQTSRFLWIEAVDAEPRREMLESLATMRAQGRSYEDVYGMYTQARSPTLGQGNIYYRTYQTRDSVIAVGSLSDPLRKKLLAVLGLSDIRFDPDYDPQSHQAKAFGSELTRKAEKLLRGRTTEEWLRVLDEAGVPAGPVRFTEELMEDPQVLANDLVVEQEHALAGRLKMVGPFIKMDQTPLQAQRPSPALGQHTDEILSALGYSPQEVQRLREEDVTR